MYGEQHYADRCDGDHHHRWSTRPTTDHIMVYQYTIDGTIPELYSQLPECCAVIHHEVLDTYRTGA